MARRLGTVARVALRVNPDIDARSHPYISTGLRQNKFGVDIRRAGEIFAKARSLPGVRMTGVQAHIGSQIVDAEPLAQTAGELAALARRLGEDGFDDRDASTSGAAWASETGGCRRRTTPPRSCRGSPACPERSGSSSSRAARSSAPRER